MKTYDPASDRDRVLLASIAYQEEKEPGGWLASQRNFANGHGVRPQFVEVHGPDWRRLARMTADRLVIKRPGFLRSTYHLTDEGKQRLADLDKPIKRKNGKRP